MKLKLDLHPIYNDTRAIEAALQNIIDEAVEKRATEIEIIPGKGSGALKKTVVRFLDRPEIKARYHRIEKDGDNWGRLFVHFKFLRLMESKKAPTILEAAEYLCFCCQGTASVPVDRELLLEDGPETRNVECPACGSPNILTIRASRTGPFRVVAINGYEE